MKRLFGIICLGLVWPSLPAGAFLSDSDPQNFFTLLEQAPAAVVASLKTTQKPEGANRYFIHELRVKEVLSGPNSSDNPKVLQELIFVNEVSLFPAEGDFLAFLAPLPGYTTFAAAREKGARFRNYGGTAAVFLLTGETRSETIALAKQWLSLKGQGGAEAESRRKDLLLNALLSTSSGVPDSAAKRLSELSIGRGFFNIENFKAMETALGSGKLKPDGQQALVSAIEKTGDAGAVDSLRRIASGNVSPARWAAIQALERMGYKRSIAELREDFSSGQPADKNRIVGLVVGRNTPEGRDFLKGLLSSSEDLNLKREVLDGMARQGGADYEAMLIEQTQSGDEQLAMQAIVSLGSVPSDAALQRIVGLLDSPSPKIRGAAGMALMRSPDPRAAKIYHERFEEQGYGHFHR